MIYVNIFNITPDQTTIQVSVETEVGYNVTSAKLWTHASFKDEAKAINLDYKLQQINNKEVFLINATEVASIAKFSGIYFLELTSNAPVDGCSTCEDPTMAVTANFSNIDICILNDIASLSLCGGNIFTDTACNGNKGINIINKSLLLKALCTALAYGYYEEAIEYYTSLLKMCDIDSDCPDCNTCTSCDSVGDPVNFTGLGYGTVGNALVLA